jgi:hypothetical protein
MVFSYDFSSSYLASARLSMGQCIERQNMTSKVVMCFILTTDKNKNDRKEGRWRDGCVIKYQVTPGGQ